MSRTFKSLVIALSGAGFLASAAGDVQACHPRARGGYGGGNRVVVVRAPQNLYQYPGGSPPVVPGQNGPVGVQFQGQQIQGQQFQGQQFQGQQIQGQAQFQGQPTTASASAISALGGGASGPTVQGQVASTAQTGFVQQGQGGAQFATSGNVTAQSQVQTQQSQAQPQFQQQGQPQLQQQAQTQQAQTQQVQAQPQVQAQAQTSQQNAQTMALQALSGLDSSETVTQASSQSAQPALTGDFSASLQSLGATIRLRLNADSSFAWIVTTKDGKTNSFQGSFSVTNGRLTLARTDNQKMEASLTPTATGFSLKMVGQNASALSFVRV